MPKEFGVLIIASNLISLAIERPINPLELTETISSFADFCTPSAEALSGIRMFIHVHNFVFCLPLRDTNGTIERLIGIFVGMTRRCKEFDPERVAVNKPINIYGGIDIGEVATLDKLVNEGPIRKASELAAAAKKNGHSLIVTASGYEMAGEHYKRLFRAKVFGGSHGTWKNYFLDIQQDN